jgi:uncharacterized membrane protein YeaQ/YmgE (transglycosylase-associated protein family)
LHGIAERAIPRRDKAHLARSGFGTSPEAGNAVFAVENDAILRAFRGWFAYHFDPVNGGVIEGVLGAALGVIFGTHFRVDHDPWSGAEWASTIASDSCLGAVWIIVITSFVRSRRRPVSESPQFG